MVAPGGSDYYLLEQNGRILEGNTTIIPPRTGIINLPRPDPDHHIIGYGEMIAPGLYAFSGSDLGIVHATQRRIVSTLLWLLGGGLVLAVLAGVLVSRSFLTRTDAMARACRTIMDGDMRARIPVRGSGDELDRLATAINEMLARIAGLMENLRQVTNDIAHDLRTPVTTLRNRLEWAHTNAASTGQYRDAIQDAIGKSDGILAQFAALLRIAQIEGGERRSAFAPIKITDLISRLTEMYEAVAEESGHSLVIAHIDRVSIRGDWQLLVQLFSNLIENAVLHTPAGTRVTLSTEIWPTHLTIRVDDTGPGVPSDEHEKLFQRLYRREASRTRPGYGLGLSLVAAIAELHGGKAKIVEKTGAGLRIEVAIPLVPET
jgi:signal transduction histidine kinase